MPTFSLRESWLRANSAFSYAESQVLDPVGVLPELVVVEVVLPTLVELDGSGVVVGVCEVALVDVVEANKENVRLHLGLTLY